VEDQPADPGDLTTEAVADETASSPRRRHRLPLQKERRSHDDDAAAPEGDAAVDVEVDDAVDAEVEDAADDAAAATPAPARRRWNFLRRRRNAADEPVADAAVDPTPEEPEGEVEPAAKTPVGKKGRPPRREQAAAAAEPEPEPEAEPVGESASETTESTDEEATLVAHRPVGRRMVVAAAVAAALFVGAGAFAGAMVQPVLANQAQVATKLEVARTAAQAITTLWSYTPENMDTLADRSAAYLTGDFAFEYRKFIDSIVASNKQAQVTNTTSVLGVAVESLTPTEASALVYTNSVATSPVTKNIPSLRYLSYRLEMKRDGSDWRISRMTTITTLDLTPQL